MGDFYVHLYSEYNRDIFPSNTHNAFSNIVKPEIILEGEYEVGVSNIFFQPDMFNILKNDEKYSALIRVEFLNKHDERGSGYSVLYTPTTNLSGNTTYELIREVNKDLVAFLKYQKVIPVMQNNIISYEPDKKYPSFTPLNIINTTDKEKLKYFGIYHMN